MQKNKKDFIKKNKLLKKKIDLIKKTNLKFFSIRIKKSQ